MKSYIIVSFVQQNPDFNQVVPLWKNVVYLEPLSPCFLLGRLGHMSCQKVLLMVVQVIRCKTLLIIWPTISQKRRSGYAPPFLKVNNEVQSSLGWFSSTPFGIPFHLTVQFKNPSIFNIIRWFAGLLGRLSQWQSVWCSKYYLLMDLHTS